MPQDWRSWLARSLDWLEWPLGVLALSVVPVLVIEGSATTPSVQTAAEAANWLIWIVFCLELAARTLLAERRLFYLRHAWFDIAILVLSPPFLVPTVMEGARSLRALRVLRLLRFVRAFGVASIGLRASRHILQRHQFHYVALVAVVATGLGAVGAFLAERDVNKSIGTLGDALWWAIVTATTVGYGDISPMTLEGRIIAVGLMLTGICVISIFTASIASFFLEGVKKNEITVVHEEIRELRGQVDRMLRILEREHPGDRLAEPQYSTPPRAAGLATLPDNRGVDREH